MISNVQFYIDGSYSKLLESYVKNNGPFNINDNVFIIKALYVLYSQTYCIVNGEYYIISADYTQDIVVNEDLIKYMEDYNSRTDALESFR